MKFKAGVLSISFFWSALALSAQPAHISSGTRIIPTHADAAYIIFKYSGLFDRYGTQDANIDDCVAFLNDHGVYFGLLEVVSGSEFTLKDCARVMGQISLVFSGDAEYLGGKVILPKDVASWEAFCIMNEVEYVQAYEAVRNAVRRAKVITR
ncbi:MAG TPA: hypothetical protein VLL07_04405 [Pontiella sp.]|nr:hypothetical protein [Pontiella sp.]